MFRTIGFVSLCLCVLASCNAATENVGQDTEALLNAPLDTTHKFDVGVCAKGLRADGTCKGGRCSGTLIAENVVLTARHCIQNIAYADPWCASTFTDPLSTLPTLVTTSDSVDVGTPKWYTVASALVEPSAGLCSDDVAVLILATSVPASEAQPVRVNVTKDYAMHWPKSVAIVGRGGTADSLETGVVRDGLMRRILENIPFVCATNDATKPCNIVDFSSPPTNAFASGTDYFVIGASTVGGDSGSGVFDQKHFNKASRSVIGVTSAGTYGEDLTPNYGLISRIDTHKALIRDALGQAKHGESEDLSDDR